MSARQHNERSDEQLPTEQNNVQLNQRSPDGRRRLPAPIPIGTAPYVAPLDTAFDVVFAADDAVQRARAASDNPHDRLPPHSPEVRRFVDGNNQLIDAPGYTASFFNNGNGLDGGQGGQSRGNDARNDPFTASPSASSVSGQPSGPAPFFTPPTHGFQQQTNVNQFGNVQQGWTNPQRQLPVLPVVFGAAADDAARLTGARNFGLAANQSTGHYQPPVPTCMNPVHGSHGMAWSNQMHGGGMGGGMYGSMNNHNSMIPTTNTIGHGATAGHHHPHLNPNANVFHPRRSRSPLPGNSVYRNRDSNPASANTQGTPTRGHNPFYERRRISPDDGTAAAQNSAARRPRRLNDGPRFPPGSDDARNEAAAPTPTHGAPSTRGGRGGMRGGRGHRQPRAPPVEAEPKDEDEFEPETEPENEDELVTPEQPARTDRTASIRGGRGISRSARGSARGGGRFRVVCDRCREQHRACNLLDLEDPSVGCGECNESADTTAAGRCKLTQADGSTDLEPARAYLQQKRRKAAEKAQAAEDEEDDAEDDGDVDGDDGDDDA